MDALTIKIETDVNPNEIVDVYRRSGISRPIDDLPRLTRMLQQANLLISARVQGQLVGFARALTDYSYCCYLSDLAVDQAYQRRGIGQQLLATLQEKLGEEVMVCLLSAPEAMSYYPKAGFQKAEQAWWIPRKH